MQKGGGRSGQVAALSVGAGHEQVGQSCAGCSAVTSPGPGRRGTAPHLCILPGQLVARIKQHLQNQGVACRHTIRPMGPQPLVLCNIYLSYECSQQTHPAELNPAERLCLSPHRPWLPAPPPGPRSRRQCPHAPRPAPLPPLPPPCHAPLPCATPVPRRLGFRV